jgi:hypothetical protein
VDDQRLVVEVEGADLHLQVIPAVLDFADGCGGAPRLVPGILSRFH